MIKLFSYAEAAKELEVSIESIKRYVKKGVLPTVKFSSHMIRIPADKLMRFVETGGLVDSKGA